MLRRGSLRSWESGSLLGDGDFGVWGLERTLDVGISDYTPRPRLARGGLLCFRTSS